MEQPRNLYQSFLIRLWLEDQDDAGVGAWRIELESIQSGQKRQFPDLDAMLFFFRERIKTTQMEQTKNKAQDKGGEAG